MSHLALPLPFFLIAVPMTLLSRIGGQSVKTKVPIMFYLVLRPGAALHDLSGYAGAVSPSGVPVVGFWAKQVGHSSQGLASCYIEQQEAEPSLMGVATSELPFEAIQTMLQLRDKHRTENYAGAAVYLMDSLIFPTMGIVNCMRD